MNNILPKDWKWLKFDDVCEIKGGKNQSSVINPNGKYPIYGSSGIFGYADQYICDEGTTVIGRKGTINTPIYVTEKFWNVDTAFGLCSKKNIDGKFLYYFCLGFNFHALDKSTTIPSLAKRDLLAIDIPIPQVKTQQLIVSKIEELFSELDKGIENLKTAQQQLKTYRQSVLKWAFEGKLTEDWRKGKNCITGLEVLQAIKRNRINVLGSSTSEGNKESNRILNKIEKHKFKIPENIEIPKEWSWSSFLNGCFLVIDCHNKTAPYQNSGIFLIRTSNIRNGKLLLEKKMKFVSEKTYEYWSRRCPPSSGDILFTREAPMGESAIIPPNTKVCMGQRIMLLRTFPELLSTRYLHYAMMESVFQERMNENAIGTGVKHLRVGDVEQLVFPICSIYEQNKIVQEIESRLSVADKMEESISQSLEQSEALRQSILKKAFEGKLI